MLRYLAPAALVTTSLLIPRTAAADTCTPSRVMVVLDKSSSMQTGKIGTQTKWSVAVNGLGQVLDAYQTNAEFGLMTFPRPNQCSPGGLDVAPAMNNKQPIVEALATPPPDAGNWTPMAQTLEAAANEQTLLSAVGPRHVVLISDGWQWCSPYDSSTRYDGTAAVEKLNAAGITTWVVGFGSSVDASALNRMAVAANTAKPNCDPAGDDPAGANNCYYQVDDEAALVSALMAIAQKIVVDETCDGLDNNCDGAVDENLQRECANACGAGSETCSNGAWTGCSAPVVATETCDAVDNDCDGQTDEPGTDLCDVGEVCSDGLCEPTGGVAQAGCCSTNRGVDASALMSMLVLGVILFGRRRRR